MSTVDPLAPVIIHLEDSEDWHEILQEELKHELGDKIGSYFTVSKVEELDEILRRTQNPVIVITDLNLDYQPVSYDGLSWLLDNYTAFKSSHEGEIIVLTGYLNNVIRDLLTRKGISSNHIMDKVDFDIHKFANELTNIFLKITETHHSDTIEIEVGFDNYDERTFEIYPDAKGMYRLYVRLKTFSVLEKNQALVGTALNVEVRSLLANKEIDAQNLLIPDATKTTEEVYFDLDFNPLSMTDTRYQKDNLTIIISRSGTTLAKFEVAIERTETSAVSDA